MNDIKTEDEPYDREAMKEFLGMEPAAAELIVRIMHANAENAAHLGNQLTEAYKAQAEKAEATLGLIRVTITDLLDGRYTPNPNWIRNALFPSAEAVEAFLEGGRGSM
jgi:hypothetical protein